MKLNREHPLFGLCYVLSEAFYHVAGKAAGFRPYRLRWRKDQPCHWWLQHDDGRVIDLTADQFVGRVPYERGVGCGFLTRQPCKRTQAILRVMGETACAK